MVEKLASDDLAGRDNQTPGSLAAQDFLVAQLQQFADPILPDVTGPDGYKIPFDVGTNLFGVIPGSDLADQYVIIGAHYDHLGSDCTGSGPADSICNGATDNATGVAAALAIGQAIAGQEEGGPRRTVIIALWDAEEDGLLGSAAYLANPVVPLADTVAYINFDIQGTNISPALRNTTVVVGAETGGANLVAETKAATAASSLNTVALSLLFGQGRSDHANFVNAGIPSVFFTDATPPCYHTVGDDASIVDYPKLEQQVNTARTLAETLADTDDVPTFTPGAPPATYEDAVAIHDLLVTAQPDFSRFSDADRAAADAFVTTMGGIVDAGAAAFDSAAVGTLLNGTLAIVQSWATGTCDGFLNG
ncbi:MAG: peptidase [Ilumatobacteraceae bacterium]|nr:peptidase [Ilumatobacteraceae bacterium]